MKIINILVVSFLCWAIFYTQAAASLKGSVTCEDKTVSQESIQKQIDQIVPPALSRSTMQTNRGNTLQGHVQVDSDTTVQSAPLPGGSAPPQYGLADPNKFKPLKGEVTERQLVPPVQQALSKQELYAKLSPESGPQFIPAGQQPLPLQAFYAQLARESDPLQMAFNQLQPLHGLFAKLGRPKSKRLQGQAEVGMPGYLFQLCTHIVTYVDPHSDAYGKVFPGDRVLSVGGIDPEFVWNQHKLGIVDERAHPVVFVRNGTMVFTVYCKNYPMSIFPAFMQKAFWTPI